ncbi:MAG TPA: NADP-dependent phosphogluconate dehydrogenase [Azospirillum sp.]
MTEGNGAVDVIVVMGVCGSGKSSVGRHLARRLGWPFLEGDDFHPPENVARMAAGVPLRDEDRRGWLDAIAARLAVARAQGRPVVVSCSALKRRYRDRLRAGAPGLLFVHLDGARETILDRMARRTGHFMPASLLDSQLAELERPAEDERALVCDIGPAPEEIAARVAPLLAGLGLDGGRVHQRTGEASAMAQGNSADIGVIGLGVMGRNLAANLADHGAVVAGTDLDDGRRAALAADVPGGVPCAGPEEMLAVLKAPRVVLMMVPAGAAVDALLSALLPRLSAGDVLIDGGNSHYQDTRRRAAQASAAGVHFIGLGVSGGEEGARRGPALMAGGTVEGIGRVAPLLRAIAARAADGEPCFARVGPDGAGHFVKMIHNGIEYADMQLIAEGYHLLRHLGGVGYGRLAEMFAEWNGGELASYLMEITADILRTSDPETGAPILEVIRDAAGQKGTGHWATTAAMELGMPAPTIAEAVHARCLSALKEERGRAASAFPPPPQAVPPDGFAADVGDALLCGRIAVYAQGFAVIAAGSRRFGWDVDLAAVAAVWRGGCIIRARLVDRILAALRRTPDLPNLMFDPDIAALLARGEAGWRRTVGAAVAAGQPVPAMASALSYWDGYRSDRLWANMIQAQRDFFGAHGYERTDRPGMVHTDWSSGR